MKEEEGWLLDTWTYLYSNELIPVWMTFPLFKGEWSDYVKEERSCMCG